MNITITPTTLHGFITPPPSKSQAHRLIIAAALADGESVLSNVDRSQDIEATARCVQALGARICWEDDVLTVTGIGAGAPAAHEPAALPRLDCGESGSTLRFLIPVALAVRGGGVFTGRGRLMERPQQPYFDLFDEKGISYEQSGDTLTVSGTLTPGEYRLPGDVSSQFFTGLMLALPLLEGDSRIVLTSPLESGGYVELTRDVLREAGVFTDQGLIPGCQTYRPLRQTVETDWSQAAFFYAAHALGNDLHIQGLNPFSAQGDSEIVTLYTQLCLSEGEETVDVRQYPDLFPPLAAMAALRPGALTHITGAARLRLKESDRIAAAAQVLTALGVQNYVNSDGMSILGEGQLRGDAVIDCCGDHRIAMMAAVLATRCQAPVTLTGAQCVDKSYPRFWEDYESLGGILRREG